MVMHDISHLLIFMSQSFISQLNRKNRREGESERFITTKKLFFKDLNWGTDIFNPDRQEYLGIKVGADELNCMRTIAYQNVSMRHRGCYISSYRLKELFIHRPKCQ